MQTLTHTPPSPLSSRHSSQDSLHKNALCGSGMLNTSTASMMGISGVGLGSGGSGGGTLPRDGSLPRDPASVAAAAAAAQKKKGIKSSLGRFFSKKEKVIFNLIFVNHYPG